MRKLWTVVALFLTLSVAITIAGIAVWLAAGSDSKPLVSTDRQEPGWEFKPVVVNVQVDLEEEGDQLGVDAI